ncbi:MAG: Gfo/Idh/MocA family oxidoreductase [Opitutales bacterium]
MITRRNTLKAGALLGGSLLYSRFSIGEAGPAAINKLNVALIGAGGIARTAFADCRRENVVAIAEVDDERGVIGFNEFPNAKRYKDFRKMLDVHYKELDLVIISTPDHTHFAATYAAMERGIAVHTQKPLTHNIWEARTLKAAAKKYKVQTVMGNQGHNFEGMRFIKDWYDAGLAGNIMEVHAWTNRTTMNNANARRTFRAQSIPYTLDWELWQGPVLEKEYHETYCPKGWRWHWDYGLGGLGDIGCHTLDIPVFCMGLGYPTAVYMDDTLDFREEFDGKKPKDESATYVYEFPAEGSRPAVKVYWYEGGRMPRLPMDVVGDDPEKKKRWVEGGCLLIGDKNTIVSRGMRPTSPRMQNDWEDIRRSLPEKTTPRAIGNPVKEIMAVIRGEIPQCGSNFDYAAPLTEIVCLGTLANRFQKRVEFIPETMTFKDASLNPYVRDPVRAGWEYGEGLI